MSDNISLLRFFPSVSLVPPREDSWISVIAVIVVVVVSSARYGMKKSIRVGENGG